MAHNSINLEVERMLPSLEFYIAAQILTKEEVRDIISARSEFEYKLHSTAPLLRHYIAAIEYECQLHRILHDREACVGHTEHKFRRSTLSRIQRLYRRGIRAFRKNSENEQSMIQHYLQFLSRMDPIQGNRAERPDKPMKAKKISQFLAQRITSHPTDANLWTAEAHVDASTYGDISRVRNILNRALRIVPESLCIHRERCRGELDYLAKLMTVARDELDEASRRRVYNDTFKKLICIPMCLVEGLVDSRLQSTPGRRKRLHSDPASTVDKSENISEKIGRTDLKFSDLRQTFLEPIQQYVWAELEILLPVYSLFFENFPLDCFQDFVHYVLTRHSSLHATNATSPECSLQLEGNSLERFLFSDESKKQNDCVEQQLDTYQDLDTHQSSPLVRLLLPMRSASIEILKLSATYVVLVPSSPVAWNNFLHVVLLSATNYPISELDNVTKILSLVTKNTSSRANLAVTPRDLDALNKVFQRQFHNLGGDQGYTKILNSLEADAEAYHCAQMPCTPLEAQNGLSHDALYQVVEKLLRLDSKTLCTSWNSVPSPHSEEHRAIFQNFLQSLLTQLCTGARDLLRPGGMAICALALHALKCDNAQAPHTSSPVMGIEEAFALFRGEGNTGDAKTVKRGMGKIDTEEASTCATLLWSIYRILTFHKASWDPSSRHERRVVGASSSPGGNMVGSTNTGRALLGENTTAVAHESETRSVWLSMKGEWEHFRHEVVSFMRLCNPRSRPELFTCFTKVYVWCSTVLKSLGPISHSNACSTLFDDCVLEEKNYVLPCDTYDFLLDPTTRIELNIPPEVARKWFEGWIRSVETCEDALKAWIAYMKFEQEQSLYLGEGKAPNVQDLYGRAKEHFKEIIKQSSLCSSVLLEKSEKGKGSSSRHDDANPMSQLHFAYQRILQ